MLGIETKVEDRLPRYVSPLGTILAKCRRAFGATARKTALAITDQVVVSGTRFFTSVVIGRTCGMDELGVYTLGLTVVFLIMGIQQALILGPYNIYISRVQGRARAEYFGSVLVQHALLALLTVVCLLAIATVLSTTGAMGWIAGVIWMLAGLIPFFLLQDFIRRLAFGQLNMTFALVVDLIAAAVQVGALLVLAAAGVLTAGTTFAAVGLACAVASVFWFVRARSTFVCRWKQVPGVIRQHWTFGRWIFANQTTAFLAWNGMNWALAFVLDTQAVGVFAACVSVVAFSNPLIMAIGNVLAPRTAQALTLGGALELRRVVRKSIGLVGVLMGLFCIVVAIIGDDLVRWMYGSGIPAGQGYVITVMALSLMATSMSDPANHGLLALEHPKTSFKITLLGSLATLAVASLLMVHHGALGVACGSLAGALVASTLRCFAFFRLLGTRNCELPAQETIQYA